MVQVKLLAKIACELVGYVRPQQKTVEELYCKEDSPKIHSYLRSLNDFHCIILRFRSRNFSDDSYTLENVRQNGF